MAKSACSDAGREVTASAIQAHGGIGFTWEADVHWLYKRAQLDAGRCSAAASTTARGSRGRSSRTAWAHQRPHRPAPARSPTRPPAPRGPVASLKWGNTQRSCGA